MVGRWFVCLQSDVFRIPRIHDDEDEDQDEDEDEQDQCELVVSGVVTESSSFAEAPPHTALGYGREGWVVQN